MIYVSFADFEDCLIIHILLPLYVFVRIRSLKVWAGIYQCVHSQIMTRAAYITYEESEVIDENGNINKVVNRAVK